VVTKEDVEQLMLKHLPLCPLCGSKKGYEVSGIAKTYIQCMSCGAKWWSSDFGRCKELKELELTEPSYDGKGAPLKRKKHSVKFWQDSEAIKKALEIKLTESKTKLIFQPQMTNQQLQKLIVKSLEEISNWDYGATIAGKGLSFLIDGTSIAEASMVRLLRGIFEQNKIIILQNELIRRKLSKHVDEIVKK